MSRIPLVLSAVFYLIYRLIRYYTEEIWLPLLIFLIPITLLLLNLILRRSLKYKAWFLSSLNILLEKKTYSLESDISTDLLLDKLTEVIKESKFKLLDINKEEIQILCGTSINFWTWGENIYVELNEEMNGNTKIQFISTTLFGGTSWNRNQKNYESFIDSFETSLTI